MAYSKLQQNPQAEISTAVKSYISHLHFGKVFTTAQILKKKNFTDEQRDAISSTLSRMNKKKEIMRVSNGVYYRPKLSKFGRLPIETKELIAGLAKKKDATITPAGLAAVNALGLDTQLPMVKSYIISERIRAKIDVKNIKIEYKESSKFFINHFDVKEEETRKKAFMLWSALSYLDKSGVKYHEEKLACKFKAMLAPTAQVKFFNALPRSMKWVPQALMGADC